MNFLNSSESFRQDAADGSPEEIDWLFNIFSSPQRHWLSIEHEIDMRNK